VNVIAQTFTAAAPHAESLADSLGPVIAIVSLLWGGWQAIRASNKAALLRAAIVGVKAGLDSLAAVDAEKVKQQIELAAGGRAAPLNQALKAEVRKTTVERVAYTDDPPPPPRLAALLLAATLLLAPGCVSQAARDLAVAHEAHLIAFDGASVPHPAYTTDDSEPGPDGKKLTAAEKLAAWRAARAEVLRSAHALSEALR
jgi:hypothetical protein